MKFVLGITGGVGSGKSTVLEILKKLYDAKIFMADNIGHTAFEKNTASYKKIVDHFGEKILDENKEINRNTLSGIVFKKEDEMKFLNSVIHPMVKERIDREIKEWRKNKDKPSPDLFVLETALMFETRCDKFCDGIWGIVCNENDRIKRLAETRGYSEDKAKSIIRSQLPESSYASLCDNVIENNGTYEDLENEIKKVINIYMKVYKI